MFFKTVVSESFLIKLQAIRTAALLKRDSNTGVFLWNLRNVKNNFFHRTPPVYDSDCFRFPACNFIENETPAKMFFCKFCKVFKNFFWQNTCGWLLLVFIGEFWEVFQNTSLTEHLWETAYFMLQAAEFQPADAVKNLTSAFQVFYKRMRRRYSKALIYLKSLKTKCEEVNLSWSCEM